MSKCKACLKVTEEDRIAKALKKLGYEELGCGDGTMNAKIVIKCGFLNNRYFWIKKKEAKNK